MQAVTKAPTLITVQELARRWGVHPCSVKRWLRMHSLQAVRIGGRHMVRIAEIEHAEQKGLPQ